MTPPPVSDVTTPRLFDVFLSHNSREKPAVERIAEGLKRDAVEPWLDKWCLTPGGDWQDELAEGLRRSNSCAVFVGPEGIGDWARLEFKLATDRMAKDRNFRVFLVLLPGLPEPFDTSSLPPFLTTRTWVDMRKGVADPRAFQALINAIRGVAPGPEKPIAARDDVCPYQGLRAFDEEHSEFFFGRDADIQRLVEKLKTTRFLAVLGPSGSGKSSVVRAGLIPALRKGSLPGSEAWRVQVFTPGARPLTQLAANLVRLNPQSSAVRTLDELMADERSLHLACAVALAERPESERVVWVVDQLEEVFTLCRDEAERARFISNLLYAAGVPGGRGLVVLTMRADFYQKSVAYPELSAQVASQQFLVSPLSTEGLRQAIAEPAWRVGLEFEQGLVETVLEDVEGQPGALPLLEHALLELWKRRRGRLLTLEGYRETGGVEGAIAKRADAVFESFDAESQTIARRVMLRLTQPGEGTEDTRRRATLAELVTRPEEAEQVHYVVRALADARLLTAGGDGESGAEIVDVSHEALIRSWPRLRRWVEDDRQGLRTHRRVTEAAQEWESAGRDESLLFRGARLTQSLEWRERSQSALNESERAFLAASAEVQERERFAAQRRTRNIFVGLVAALVLISAASVYAFIQSRLATRQREESFARELAANAMAQLFVNPELSLRLAVEAAQRARLPETETTLRQVLAKTPRHALHPGAPGPSHNTPETTHEHRLEVTSAHNGRLLVLIYGKSFRIFDAEAGRLLFEQQLGLRILSAAGSPTTDLIAFALADDEGVAQAPGVVQLWEAGTGRAVATLPTNGGLAFSHDGKLLVVAAEPRTQVFEVSSGRVVAEVEGGSPSFSSDGGLLLTKVTGEAPLLFVTDTSDWRRVAEIPSTPQLSANATLGAISPDGRYVVAGSWDAQAVLRLHESRGGRVVRTLNRNVYNGPNLAEFSPDGRLVAFADQGKLVTWDMGVAGAEPEVVGDLTSNAFGLSFSPDGRLLLGVGGITAQVYDLKSRRLIAEFRAATGATLSAAEFSPDGRSLLTTNTDDTAYVWDLSVARAQTVLTAPGVGPSASAGDAVISRDGKLAAYASWRGAEATMQVWEAGVGRPARLLKPGGPSGIVAFSPDSTKLLTNGEGSAQVWELVGGRVVAELRHGRTLSGAAYSPDGKLIATSGEQRVKLWAAGDGRLLAEVASEGYVKRGAFSPDGRTLLLTEGGRVRAWDIASHRAVLEFGEREKGDLGGAAYSPDAKYILTWEWVEGGWKPNSLQVRDAVTGRVVIELNGHVDRVFSAAFSPNGEYVLTTSGFTPLMDIVGEPPSQEINVVRVWELRSGNSFYEFRDHGSPVLDGAFAADGKSVRAIDQSGVVSVYACELCATLEELLHLAERRSVRPLTPDERVRYLHE
jgi:WD40 repeat protein